MTEHETERLLRAWLADADEAPAPGGLHRRVQAIPSTIRLPWHQRLRLDGVGGLARDARRSRTAWAIAIVLLLVAFVGGSLLVGGTRQKPVVVVGPMHSPLPSARAVPTPTPSDLGDVGPCGTGRVRVLPGTDTGESIGPIEGLGGISVALVTGLTRSGGTSGSFWVIDGGAARPVAHYSGTVPANEIRVVDWSADGTTLLVTAGNLSLQAAERDCSDLYLVRTDGSAVTKLTDNGPGSRADLGALSPDGTMVVYQEIDPQGHTELRLADATPASIALDDTPCAGPGLDRIDAGASALLWSPAGDRIAAVCSSAVTVYKTLDRSAHTISVPKGTLIVSAAWSASPYHVIVATAKAGASQLGPLTVLSLGADSGASQVLASSQLSVEWVLPGTPDGFSPDGHWLVVDGGLPESVPGADFQDQLYVVDLQSGATRPLAPPSALLGSFIGWMPDSSGAVFSGSFSAEDVSGVRHSFVQVAPGDLARTTMGSLPESSYGSVLLWRPTGVP